MSDQRTDVFETNGHDNFHTGEVEIVVNGQSKGKVNPGTKTLGAFVKEQATRYGIRAFSVYLDGEKAETSQGADTLEGVAKLEIVAKDARGSRNQ